MWLYAPLGAIRNYDGDGVVVVVVVAVAVAVDVAAAVVVVVVVGRLAVVCLACLVWCWLLVCM